MQWGSETGVSEPEGVLEPEDEGLEPCDHALRHPDVSDLLQQHGLHLICEIRGFQADQVDAA